MVRDSVTIQPGAPVARRSPSLPGVLSWFASRRLPVFIFVTLLGIAFFVGVRTTWGLQWPDNKAMALSVDLYRDIAAAQAILDFGYGPDPTYLGERTWYNPMTPAMLASVSVATGWPLHVIAVQIGAYANLLAPICFFLMCTVLFDRWTALFASAGFLFLLPGSLPSYVSATYSPWFLPINFVQMFFYLSIIALYRAYRDGRILAFLAAGLLWGLTFLGHTGPALMLGGITTGWVGLIAWSSRRDRPFGGQALGAAMLRYGLMIGCALCVSAPLVAIIVGHYGLRVKNGVPAGYSEPLLSRELPTLIWLHVTVPMLIAAVGCWVLVRRASRPTSRRLLLLWIATAIVFLGYGFLRLGVKLIGPVWPSMVPSFHFFFYFKAAAAVLFGIGLTMIGWTVARLVSRRAGSHDSPRAMVAAGRSIACLICLALLLVQARTYALREDFTVTRRGAMAAAGSNEIRVFEWLVAHRKPMDVALAGDRDAAVLFSATGVKAVMAVAAFSNPYVDLQPRIAARDHMFEALDRHDSAAFRELADRYGVTLVFARPPRTALYDARTPRDLELVFTAGTLRLYRVRPSGDLTLKRQ